MAGVPEDYRDLFNRFTHGPTLLRAAVAGLDGATMNRRPPGEDWSIRDIVMHLADAELVGAMRVRLVIAQDEPQLPVFDREAWKRRLQYLWRDPEAAISLFHLTRYSTAEIVQNCGREAWARAGWHPERGPTTLAELVEMYAAHVDEHVEQIGRFRR